MLKYKDQIIYADALGEYESPIWTFTDHIVSEYNRGIKKIASTIGEDFVAVLNKANTYSNQGKGIFDNSKDVEFIVDTSKGDNGVDVIESEKIVHLTSYPYIAFDVYVKGIDKATKCEMCVSDTDKPFTVLYVPKLNEEKRVLERFGTEYAFKNLISKGAGISFMFKNVVTLDMKVNTFNGLVFEFLKSKAKAGFKSNLRTVKETTADVVLAAYGGLSGLPKGEVYKNILSIRDVNFIKQIGLKTDLFLYDFNLESDTSWSLSLNNSDKFKARFAEWSTDPAKSIIKGDIDLIKDSQEAEEWDCKYLMQDQHICTDHKFLIGKELSRPVTIDGEVIAHENDVIDEELINKCLDREMVIFYRDFNPYATGYIYRPTDVMPIILEKVRKGSVIPNQLKELFPEENGMYSSKEYENVVLPAEDMELVAEPLLLEFMSACGVKSILLKTSHTSKSPTVLPLESEWFFYDRNKTRFNFFQLLHFVSVGFKLSRGDHIPFINMDQAFNKILMPISEVMYDSYKAALRSSELSIRNKAKSIKESKRKDYNTGVEAVLFDGTNFDTHLWGTVSQRFWDELYPNLDALSNDNAINPIAYYSLLGRVTHKGLGKHSSSEEMRAVALLSYGRIDPYETPQSLNVGLDNNLCMYVKVDEDGNIMAPFRKVSNGVISDEVEWLTARDSSMVVTADIVTYKQAIESGENDLIMAIVPEVTSGDTVTLTEVYPDEVQYVTAFSTQHLSVSTSMMPFLTSNYAIRVTYGQQQTKQGKAIIQSEVPRVITRSWGTLARFTPKYYASAKGNGVFKKNNDVMINYRQASVPTGYRSFGYTTGKESMEYFQYKPVEYNKNSLSYFYPARAFGHEVKKNKTPVFLSNWVSDDGYLKLGKNALVAYLATGYNHDDGLTISDYFSSKTASIAITREELTLSGKVRIAHQNGKKIPKYSYVKKGDVVMTYKKAEANQVSSFGRLRENATATDMQLTAARAGGFYLGTAINSDLKSKDQIKPDASLDSIFFSISASIKGDKFSNRFGNKGTVTQILDPENCYRVANEEPIDFVYNYDSVGSRMNLGQIISCNLGLVAGVLDIRVCSDSVAGITKEEVKYLLKMVYDLANSGDDFDKMVTKYSKGLGTKFKTHLLEKRKWIQYWAGCFDEEGKGYLHILNGDVHLQEKCLIGFDTIFKMIQEADEGIGSRAGFEQEQYNLSVNAPNQGSHRGGGQKKGTMESDALMAYGALDLINEIQNERGDNSVKRSNLMIELLAGDQAETLKSDEKYALRRSTEKLLAQLACIGLKVDFPDNTLVYPTEDTEVHRQTYKKSMIVSSFMNKISSIVESEDKTKDLIDSYFDGINILDPNTYSSKPQFEYDGELIEDIPEEAYISQMSQSSINQEQNISEEVDTEVTEMNFSKRKVNSLRALNNDEDEILPFN